MRCDIHRWSEYFTKQILWHLYTLQESNEKLQNNKKKKTAEKFIYYLCKCLSTSR